MRNMAYFCRSLVILLSISALVSSASTSLAKEHKKKLLDKLRAQITASDMESPNATIPVSADDLDKLSIETEAEKVAEEEVASPGPQDEVGGQTPVVATTGNKTETEVPEPVTNPYLARFRMVFKRVMEMLGLRRRKDGRQSRLIAFEDNDLDRVPVYKEEVRTTVGAVLGQKECIEKVACVSGTYLKSIKGKQLIFAFLDVFSPTAWKDTVRIAKQSAIFNEDCDYKCLED